MKEDHEQPQGVIGRAYKESNPSWETPSPGAELRGRLQPDCVKVFAGCGHPMMREQPEAVNRLIEELMQMWNRL